MNAGRLGRRDWLLSGVLTGLVLAIGLRAAHAQPSVAGSQEKVALWQDACREIVAGHIDVGARSIHKMLDDRVAGPDVELVARWLKDYEKLQRQRDGYREKDHMYEVSQAKEAAAKADWVTAMAHVSHAHDTAKDPNTFVTESSIEPILSQSKAQAEALYRKGEWNNAAKLYAYLETVQKNDKELERMRKRCVRHVRLEMVYKKDNKQKWQNDLKGIEETMVRDAFLQVGRSYVRTANFKAALGGGIDNLRVLAKTTSLADTFQRLADREAVVRFTGELTSLAHKIDEENDVDARQAYHYFEQVLKINARTLELPEALVISEFMDGALEPLDRFSSMVWPSDLQEFKKHTMGRFQGVGIQIRKEKDGKLMVVTPLPGTPAHRAGIKVGDVILKVDGEDISALEVDDIVPKIMGPKGSTVNLTIQRGSDKPFVVALVRDVITITSIRGFKCDPEGNWDYMIDPEQRIGYIRIDPSFTDGTVQEMKAALETLNRQAVRALILDLRFNPGGLLRTAIEVTELFLPKGQSIVSTRGDHSDPWPAKSSAEQYFNKDLIVLVNEASASASEIVAGALQDNRRAMILGARTHGKGSVQNLISLANDTAYLKLTTALYYLPSNRCPDRQTDSDVWGVTPEIPVALWPEEIAKAIQIRRDSDILAIGGAAALRSALARASTQAALSTSQPTSAVASRPTTAPVPVEDRPDVDPQVETAKLVLRVKLLSGQPWAWSEPSKKTNATARQTTQSE